MSVRGALAHRAQSYRRRALRRVRSRSPRVVSVPPMTGIGVGNMFSFWLWAHSGRLAGQDCWVRRTDAMNPWLDVFPNVRPLLIEQSAMRFLDRRDEDWYQDFDRFPRAHFESFIQERLLDGGTLPLTAGDPAEVTVNVRRGDYYSDPKFRALYGFDIAAYVRLAIDGQAAAAPITSIQVVSDDHAWCQRELGFLAAYGTVRNPDRSQGPAGDLGRLASARRLVLANSTFSYWGAYLSNVRYGDNHSLVWAPEFHSRGLNGGKAFQLDPRWSIVRNVVSEVAR